MPRLKHRSLRASDETWLAWQSTRRLSRALERADGPVGRGGRGLADAVFGQVVAETSRRLRARALEMGLDPDAIERGDKPPEPEGRPRHGPRLTGL